MKKIATSLFLAMTIVHLSAQYCGNSGPSICTPPANLGAAGLYPIPANLSPLINGLVSSTVIDFQNFDTVEFDNQLLHINSVAIDTVANLPSGLCWASSSPTNSWTTSGTGCIVVSGTPCDNPGQYLLDIKVTVSTQELGTIGPISSAVAGLYYYVRLDNSGDPVTPIDTNGQSAGTNDFISYDESPICSGLTCTLTASVTSTSITCYGLANGTAVATGASGTMPYSYSWNTGATTARITGLQTGTYSVTITDSVNCTAITSVNIGQPEPISYTYAVSNVSCFGDSDGSIRLIGVTGGTLPYHYLWSNGETVATAIDLAPGSYTFTVTDSNGCTAPDSAVVTHPEALSILVSSTPATNGSNGTASVYYISGGVPPYHYKWSNNDTLRSDSSLAAGNYIVTVTDANGCSISDTVAIILSGITPVDDQLFDVAIFPNPASDAVTLRLQSTNILQIRINITDAAGQIVYTGRLTVTGMLEHKIPVNNFAPGIYLMEASTDNQSVRQQFVISR